MNPTIIEVTDIDITDGCTATHYEYGAGKASSVVEHYKIIGGGHSWPGAPINNNAITNRDFNASQEIWRFLRRYRLNHLKTVLSTTTNSHIRSNFSASPNPVKDILTIQSDKILQAAQLSVTDILGRKIALQTVLTADGNLQVVTSSWRSGAYLLKIYDNNTASYRRVIKL